MDTQTELQANEATLEEAKPENPYQAVIDYRKKARLTVAECAKAAGINQYLWSYFEQNQAAPDPAKMLEGARKANDERNASLAAA